MTTPQGTEGSGSSQEPKGKPPKAKPSDISDRLNQQKAELTAQHQRELEAAKAAANAEVEAAKQREAKLKQLLGVGPEADPEEARKKAEQLAAAREETARESQFQLAAIKAGMDPGQVDMAYALVSRRGALTVDPATGRCGNADDVAKKLLEERPNLKAAPSKPAVGGSTARVPEAAGGAADDAVDMSSAASVRKHEKSLLAKVRDRMRSARDSEAG